MKSGCSSDTTISGLHSTLATFNNSTVEGRLASAPGRSDCACVTAEDPEPSHVEPPALWYAATDDFQEWREVTWQTSTRWQCCSQAAAGGGPHSGSRGLVRTGGRPPSSDLRGGLATDPRVDRVDEPRLGRQVDMLRTMVETELEIWLLCERCMICMTNTYAVRRLDY